MLTPDDLSNIVTVARNCLGLLRYAPEQFPDAWAHLKTVIAHGPESVCHGADGQRYRTGGRDNIIGNCSRFRLHFPGADPGTLDVLEWIINTSAETVLRLPGKRDAIRFLGKLVGRPGRGQGGAGTGADRDRAKTRQGEGEKCKRRRGRTPDTDAQEDKRIAGAWGSKQYKTHADLAGALGKKPREVKLALDRVRWRKRSKKQRRSK